MRPTSVYNPEDGKWYDYDWTAPEGRRHIVDDTMPPTEHPEDGRIFESKSAFRRHTQEIAARTGIELREVGNERNTSAKPYGQIPKVPGAKEIVKHAVYMARDGYSQEQINRFIREKGPQITADAKKASR